MNLLLHTRKVIINLQNIKDSEAHAKLAGNAFTNSSVTTMESGYPSPSGALCFNYLLARVQRVHYLLWNTKMEQTPRCSLHSFRFVKISLCMRKCPRRSVSQSTNLVGLPVSHSSA